MLAKVVLSGLVTVGPLAGWCILTKEKESKGYADDDDTRNNEGYSPSDVLAQVVVGDKGGVDGRHEEVCDTTTSVTETGSERVGGTNNLLVEETSGPYLARHEATTEDTDEETDGVKSSSGLNGASEECRDGANDETSGKGPPWSKAITRWTSNKTNEKSGSQSNDVGVGNLHLGDVWVKLSSNDICEEGWEGVPFWLLAKLISFSGNGTYHDQKAIMKPNHEKKKTRPYLLIGLRNGTD